MMTLAMIAAGITIYVLLGNAAWHEMVMRPLSEADLADARSEEEELLIIEERLILFEGQRTGSASYYTVMCTFIALWPLAVLYGYVTARFLENWA